MSKPIRVTRLEAETGKKIPIANAATHINYSGPFAVPDAIIRVLGKEEYFNIITTLLRTADVSEDDISGIEDLIRASPDIDLLSEVVADAEYKPSLWSRLKSGFANLFKT